MNSNNLVFFDDLVLRMDELIFCLGNELDEDTLLIGIGIEDY